MTEKKSAKTILEKLSNRTLMSVVKERKYIDTIGNDISQDIPEQYRKRVIPTESCLELIRKDVKEQGENQFVQNLTIKELKKWNKKLDKETAPNITASSDLNNPNSSLVMKKRLKEELQKTSLEKYIIKSQPSPELLQLTLSQLGNPSLSTDKIELINLLKQQVFALGLEYIFLQLPVAVLKQMVEDADLNITTSSKTLLVRHLVDMRDYRPTPRKISNTSPKKTDPPKKKKVVKEKSTTTDTTKKRKPKPLKPEEVEYSFEDDDSVDWNPKLHKMEDIAIRSEDDADQEGSSDEEDEDSDDMDYKEHKKKGKKRSREGKRKHHRSNSKSYSGSEGEDSKKRHRKSTSSTEKGKTNQDNQEKKNNKKKSHPENSSGSR